MTISLNSFAQIDIIEDNVPIGFVDLVNDSVLTNSILPETLKESQIRLSI